MQKVRFLKDFGECKKDTFRVIMGEEKYYYHIQVNSHSSDTFGISKRYNGDIYQVVERS